MMKYPEIPIAWLPELANLAQENSLQGEREANLDFLTEMAALVLEVPVAIVSIPDDQRFWFKSKIGIEIDSSSREVAFCEHAIAGNHPLVVFDALLDSRFNQNPLVLNSPNIRFYMGIPLKSMRGNNVGVFCIIDFVARELPPKKIDLLTKIAALAELIIQRDEIKFMQVGPDANGVSESSLIEASEKLFATVVSEVISCLYVHQVHAVLDRIPVKIGYWDVQLHNVFCNQIYADWYGLDVNSIQGKHISWLLGPDHYKKSLPHIEKVVAGEFVTFERDLSDGFGKVRHVQISYIPHIESGQMCGFYVLGVDITQYKQVENSIAESEIFYRSAMDHAPIGMAILSSDWKFTRVNHVLCEVVGYSRDALKQLSLVEIVHPDDMNCSQDFLTRLIENQLNRCQLEIRLINQQKEIVWVQFSAAVVRNELNQAVHFIVQLEDISERRRSYENIEHQAYFDPVTDLPNRRLLMARLEQSILYAKRYQRPMALLFLDIDHFKRINDTFGHENGDMVLKEAANMILACIRAVDIAGRLGGDEFLVILPEISQQEDAEKVAFKLLERFGRPMNLFNTTIQIATSIGIAIHDASRDCDAREMIRQADMAMYEAKGSGRNRYFIYQ